MNKYRDIIRDRLKKYRKECLECLGDYGFDDVKQTLNLMNNILSGIPTDAWPENKECEIRIRSNNWGIRLFYDSCNNTRQADLYCSFNDHTAWVQEHSKNKGRFIDFDIGGS